MKMTTLLFVLLLFGCNQANTSTKGQNQTTVPKDTIKPETKDSITSHGPNSIVRTIIQDRKGNIWMASWEGIFRYDGKSFTNIANKVSSARFFSVLEDRKGNFWLGRLAQVLIITMGNLLKISQSVRDFLIMKLQVFMKIKKVTSGSVFPEEQAVTMGNSFEIINT